MVPLGGKAKALRPDVTLITGCCGGIGGSTLTQTESAEMSLATTMKRYSRNVILLADNDGVEKQPIDCLLARHATMKSCTTTATPDRFAFNDQLKKAARAHGIGFLNTRGWFCDGNQCPMVAGHTIMYRDTGHLTVEYALELVAPFRAAFRRCLFAACPT